MLRHYLTDTGHPARLFRGGEPGFCLPSVAEALRFGALWQDSAGSTPGAVGLTVGRVGFIAGRSSIASQTTATKRPLLTTDSKSIPLLRFDGIDDCLVTPSIDFSACEAVTVILGIRKNTGTASAMLVHHGVTSSAGYIGLYAPVGSANSGNHFYTETRTTVAGGFYYMTADAPQVFGQVYASGPLLRTDKFPSYVVNGNIAFTRSVGGADPGGSSSAFQNAAINIGQQNATVYPFSGDLYSLTVIGRRLSNAEILNTSRWINQQMGRVY